jgi:hypothetical protein
MASRSLRPTEIKAREIIERLRSESIGEVPDLTAREILTQGLVEAILDVAWTNQFEEDRAISRTRVRQLVADAIEARELGESK